MSLKQQREWAARRAAGESRMAGPWRQLYERGFTAREIAVELGRPIEQVEEFLGRVVRLNGTLRTRPLRQSMYAAMIVSRTGRKAREEQKRLARERKRAERAEQRRLAEARQAERKRIVEEKRLARERRQVELKATAAERAEKKRLASKARCAARYEAERAERKAKRDAWASAGWVEPSVPEAPREYDASFRPTPPEAESSSVQAFEPNSWVGLATWQAEQHYSRSSSGLTTSDVRTIAKFRMLGMTVEALAQRYGVAKNTIHNILKGRTFGGGGRVETPRRGAEINPLKAEWIRRKLAAGLQPKDIVQQGSVSRSQVWRIRRGLVHRVD